MTTAPLSFRLLQLADASFPTGGFAHSAGLEAAVQFGAITTATALRAFFEDALWNAGFAALPFVAAGHETGGALAKLAPVDRAIDAFLSNHVANRASRTQGRAMVSTCARIFEGDEFRALDAAARARTTPGHHAPMLGAALALLGMALDEARALYLHSTLRGLVSAAVRLGVLGPQEGQRLQADLAPLLARLLEDTRGILTDGAANVAPIPEILSALHDRLYARLFQS